MRAPIVLLTTALLTIPAIAEAYPVDHPPLRLDRPFCKGPDPKWSHPDPCPRNHREAIEEAAAISPATAPTPPPPAPTTVAPVGNATVMCESGGDYSANTGNGYYGGYQFDSGTWDAYGDPAYSEANEAPPEVQDAAAASVPYDAWPNC
jgi:hypothetical protein